MIHRDLPPMRFDLDDVVLFKFHNEIFIGKIDIRDFGGSIEHDYHSYDILVEEQNMLYKHIPERDILSKIIL
ncbi:hypothetical protein NYE71_32805 [Bacillus sp. FSL K6-0273]|uniref:hypothetical protein n=1 Tax=Bacillus TaxID=1386 RepID=UPI0018CE2CB7|nr:MULTISPECIES: hypothetical protein [Bacillus cereus group]MEB9535872.1 hypothetical protein [Bacillus cereus]MBG9702279.1 hypothetical protein [Bacillus thuringiensis]MCU5415237.1 hypothetical protein [Bacillus wiedmannii]MDG1651672.1 hypothetical protein [Bacillus pacificus]MEB9726209.1 hypothetical protein [Bacillus cereus]